MFFFLTVVSITLIFFSILSFGCVHCKMCLFTTVYSSSGKQSVPRLIIPPFVVIILADQRLGYCLSLSL